MLITVKIAGAVLISDDKGRVEWFVNTEAAAFILRQRNLKTQLTFYG